MSAETDLNEAAANAKAQSTKLTSLAGVVEQWVSGDENTQVDNGQPGGLEAIAKFQKRKDQEINEAAEGILAHTTEQRQLADQARDESEQILVDTQAAVVEVGQRRDEAVTARNEAIQAQSDVADMAAQVEADADRAEIAADAAEDAVQYQYLVEDNAALLALAGMTNGQRAFVRSTEHVWRYNGSAWIDDGLGPTATKADKTALDAEVTARSSADTELNNRLTPLTDAVGYEEYDPQTLPDGTPLARAEYDDLDKLIQAIELATGARIVSRLRALLGISLDTGAALSMRGVEVFGGDHNYQFAIVADDLTPIFGVIDGEVLGAGSADATVAELDAYGSAVSTRVESNLDCAVIAPGTNHIVSDGQSLMQANEAFPRLSTMATLGNLMFGGSTRPMGLAAASFVPVGSATLQPLVATVQQDDTGVMSDAAANALPAGNAARGESPEVAVANGLKRALNDRLMVANDTTRVLVASNVAVSGRTIEQLSKGASPHLYQRYLDAVASVNGLSADNQVLMNLWMQGEFNYVPDYGGDTTEDGYLAKLLQIINNKSADAISITGQSREPLFLLAQTNGSYTRDITNLSIGMAQWRATRQRKNVFMVGPSYPMTDKGGHLDANGSRWLGWYFAKAAIEVLIYRRAFRPLEPVKIVQQGRDFYVVYRTPKPPIRFSMPYNVSTATDYADKGFRIVDADGAVPIVSRSIVGSTVVHLRVGRSTVGTPYVWYASQATNGHGCVCDSDDYMTDDLYTYLAGTSMYPAANIPALVGKPYPLQNWSIAYRLPAGWSEAA